MISSVKKINNFHMLPPIQDEILWRAPKVKGMKVILMLPLVYKEFFNILMLPLVYCTYREKYDMVIPITAQRNVQNIFGARQN